MSEARLNEILPKLERYRTLGILVAIFLIGFSMRYATRHEIFFDPDSYYFYRLAMYFSGVKTEYYQIINGELVDTLAYYPTGRIVTIGGGTILSMVIGYLYKVLISLGAPPTPEGVMNFMFIMGPVFGGMTAVVAFFLARELKNDVKIAGITSLIYAFSSFAMTRSTAGDTGQESLGDLLIFFWVLLFIKAVKASEPRRQAGYAALSGIFMVIAWKTWGGNIFYFGLVTTAALLYLLYIIFSREKSFSLPQSYLVFITVGTLFELAIDPTQPMLFRIYPPSLLAYFTAFLSLTYIISIYRNIDPRKTAVSSVAVIIIAGIASGYLGHMVELFIKFIKMFITGEKSFTGATVAYFRTSSFADFKSTYGLLLLTVPVTIAYFGYSLYKKRDFYSLLAILWVLLGIVAFRWMVRLSVYLSFILPFFLASLAAYALNSNKEKLIKKLKSRKVDTLNEVRTYKINYFIVVAVLLFFMTPHLISGINYVTGMKNADLSVMPWKDAGEWIKKNTPENALLFHWWDYGYHMQTFAERRTIVDGGNSGPAVPGGSGAGHGRNIDVAKAFTSTEEEFYKWVKPYNPENLPLYVLVSVEEFGKSGAINYHARDELFISSFRVKKTGDPKQDNANIQSILQRYGFTTYAVVNAGDSYLIWALVQRDAQGNYRPDWANKVLAKLLPFNTGLGKGMKHFKLVYQNGYVYVYKYVP
jgi:dolichyl-diphosphooligosaccharide--protein glycosyltransferase